ncbi:MAG: hypothetical protein AAF518_02670, partial [Spirochaetota bacterium]
RVVRKKPYKLGYVEWNESEKNLKDAFADKEFLSKKFKILRKSVTEGIDRWITETRKNGLQVETSKTQSK